MRVLPSAAAAAALLVTASGLLADGWSYDWKGDSTSERDPAIALAGTGSPATSENSLAKEVAALEFAQLAAWNNHDIAGYLRWYWNSPDLLSIGNGDKVVGYNALSAETYKAFGADPSSMGHTRLDRLRVKMLATDTAVIQASYVSSMSKHVDSIEDTSIVRHFSEGWRIVFESATIHSQ